MIDTLVGRSIWDEDVPTPLVYVDHRALERNIQRMAEAARRSGVALRPHAKTHKIAEVAKLQLDAGAVNVLALLSAQQSYQQTRIARVQAQAARLTDTAALYQALGGASRLTP